MEPTSTREAYRRGVRDGRAEARASRTAVAPMDWHSLPSDVKAYRRGVAFGIADTNRIRGRY